MSRKDVLLLREQCQELPAAYLHDVWCHFTAWGMKDEEITSLVSNQPTPQDILAQALAKPPPGYNQPTPQDILAQALAKPPPRYNAEKWIAKADAVSELFGSLSPENKLAATTDMWENLPPPPTRRNRVVYSQSAAFVAIQRGDARRHQ